MKTIETFTGNKIGNISIYGCRDGVPTVTLKMLERDLQDHHKLCMKAVNDALRQLPDGFYMLVEHDTGRVRDFWLGEEGVAEGKYHGSLVTTRNHRPVLSVQVGP